MPALRRGSGGRAARSACPPPCLPCSASPPPCHHGFFDRALSKLVRSWLEPRSLDETRAGSLGVRSSGNFFTPHRGGAPGAAVSVASGGVGASGAARGLRGGACGHGGLVGAPLASFGDGDSQPRSLGAAHAGSLGAFASRATSSHRTAAARLARLSQLEWPRRLIAAVSDPGHFGAPFRRSANEIARSCVCVLCFTSA